MHDVIYGPLLNHEFYSEINISHIHLSITIITIEVSMIRNVRLFLLKWVHFPSPPFLYLVFEEPRQSKVLYPVLKSLS